MGNGNSKRSQDVNAEFQAKGDGVAWTRMITVDMAKRFKIYFDGRGKFQIFGLDVSCESKKIVKDDVQLSFQLEEAGNKKN